MFARENKVTSTVTCNVLSLVEHFSFSICSPVRGSGKQHLKYTARGKTGQRFKGERGNNLERKKCEMNCSI